MCGPPDKLLHNSFEISLRFQLIESLPRLGGGWSANRQRIQMTGASIQSVVEPARKVFEIVAPAFCFLPLTP